MYIYIFRLATVTVFLCIKAIKFIAKLKEKKLIEVSSVKLGISNLKLQSYFESLVFLLYLIY